MIKVTLCTIPDSSEVEVNPQDIEIKNGRYYVNGIPHHITVGGAEILQIFYLGAQLALEKKITKEQVEEAQAIRL